MQRHLALLMLIGMLPLYGHAQALLPAASWEGLIGLYTLPTAESLPRGTVIGTYAELRFSQSNDVVRLRDTWFAGSLTVIPLERLELVINSRHELVRYSTESTGGFLPARRPAHRAWPALFPHRHLCLGDPGGDA